MTKGIQADFDRIEEEWAVIYMDNGQRFDYPVSALGEGVEVGKVRVLIVKDDNDG